MVVLVGVVDGALDDVSRDADACGAEDKSFTAAYERMSKAVNPYGDGKACSRIVRALKGEEVEWYSIE